MNSAEYNLKNSKKYFKNESFKEKSINKMGKQSNKNYDGLLN
jgi:hypothetical protein